MTTGLAAADDLVLSAAELVAALAEHERRAAVLALAVRRLEHSGEWASDGSVSITAWMRQHAPMSHRDASRWVQRGRFLDRFPAIAEAACTGVLTTGHVAALQHACSVPLEPIMTAQQVELVEIIAPLAVADAEQACRVWRARAEAIVETAAPSEEPQRALRMQRAADGVMVGSFVLDAAAAMELDQAIRTASTWEGPSDLRSGPRGAGDALMDVAAFYNKNHDRPGTPRHHAHVELSLDASTLDDRPEALDGDRRLVDHAVVDTHLCDCVIHRVLRAGNTVAAYGRARYSVPKDLFRQVAARDGGCRFPGCNRNVRYCDAHHIRYWRHMGPTDFENLTLLCSRHHHLVHRRELELKLLPNGDLHVTWPDGTHRTSEPRGVPPVRRPRPENPNRDDMAESARARTRGGGAPVPRTNAGPRLDRGG